MTRTYVTASRLAELDRTLAGRDWAIIATLARVRVATVGQLERTCFAEVSRRQARQSLASLADRRVVARLPRVVGGVRAGSAGYVYALDVAGLRLARPDQARPQRPWSVGTAFLAHSLAVTEVYVRLVEHGRTGALRLVEFVAEPGCWRTFFGPGGGRLVLKPDAFVVVRLGGYEDRWFIEVDRGTEASTTLARKCEVYRWYWASGTEQARTGVFPRVLWVVPDERRYQSLVEVLGRQPAEAWALFTVATFEQVVERMAAGAAS
jgi:hypothetical protein